MTRRNTRPRKIISVRFYKSSNGSEPVRRWLKNLPREHTRILGEDIKTVEMGWPLGMPLVRSLGKGLWEVRSHLPSGIARVLFIVVEQEMVLLHGFIKKTQKTPEKELETACKRAKDVEA